MIILIALVILGTSYSVTRLMLHARTPTPTHPRQMGAEPSRAKIEAGRQDGSAWSALDDRQLTRLLTNSATRTITE